MTESVTFEVHPDDRPNTWAEIDLAAVRHNAVLLAAAAAPARLCAVVKAWGYGHGAEQVAEAALAGGASWLGVALVKEAADLRRHLDAPILLLAEPPPEQFVDLVRIPGVRPAVYSDAGIEAAIAAVRAARCAPLPVHLKVDTGMHRVGVAPAQALAMAERIDAAPELVLEGFWTHLATSEDLDDGGYTERQLGEFDRSLHALVAAGVEPAIVHAANSGGTLLRPAARRDMVRCGIAIYGLAPAPGMVEAAGLRPAMTLKSRVSFLKVVAAGERISYGLHHRFSQDARVATVPIGYHDGVPRRLGLAGGEVLLGGHRRPIVGVVTMDQLMIDCGDDDAVRVGDEVVLFGRQGDAEISAWEWAERVDTIAYEIVCGINSSRVPRRYV